MLRLSQEISAAQVENLVQAAGFAALIGLPLNRHLTILWKQANCIGRVQDIQGRFIERLRKWLEYRGVVPAFVWVVERGRENGLHSHIVVHVPAAHREAFRQMLPRWIDGDVDAKTVKLTSVRYRVGDGYLSAVKGLLRYLLKGAARRSTNQLGITHRPQGLVMGKRAGTSQNLGPLARGLRSRSSRQALWDQKATIPRPPPTPSTTSAGEYEPICARPLSNGTQSG